MNEKALMQRYMNGWKNGNANEILGTLADDCLIIESHGPTYRGKENIKKWIADWFGQGNVIEKWTVTAFYVCGNTVVYQWVFAYKGKIREAFEGATISQLKNGKISDLREYRMTAFPYMWQPPK